MNIWHRDFSIYHNALISECGQHVADFSDHIAAFQALQRLRDPFWKPVYFALAETKMDQAIRCVLTKHVLENGTVPRWDKDGIQGKATALIGEWAEEKCHVQ